MIRAVIIEDEVNSRELLQRMLARYCKDVLIEGTAKDVQSGISLIRKVQPELIFLDVEMPGGTGFDVLNAFERPEFKVIFVTGYDHYAIKAIRYSAIDYLLKAVNMQDLKAAMERVRRYNPVYRDNLQFFKKQVEKAPEEIDQIVLPGNKSHTVIKTDQIIFLEAERSYVIFHLEDDKTHIASNPLNYYEELLPATHFFRIHKSYLVNCKKVVKLDAGRGGRVYMEERTELPVATRRKPAFVHFLENLSA